MKIIKPDEFERHIILYTKNWYVNTNSIEDIRKIIAEVSGSELQYITYTDAYNLVVKTSVKYLSQFQLEEGLRELFRYKRYNESNVAMEEICQKLLGQISIIPVKTDKVFIDLGEPDYSILPKQII